jgi:hypothetical protein
MLRIFVEGKEKIFLERYIEIKFSKINDTDFKIISTGGWTSLNRLRPEIQEYTDKGDKLCIIFDADVTANNGGFSKRLTEIKAIINSIGYPNIDIFLLPNNSLDGDFETLLEEISNADRKGVYECFDNYESCIKAKLTATSKNFISPLRKSRIFAYIDSLPKNKNENEKYFKKGNYQFENLDYWNLDSPYLEPLKQFLAARL